MSQLHPNGTTTVRPMSWSAVPVNDPAAHEQIIKYLSESIVCDIQGNISSGFMRQVQASKKSAMSPHDKAERMRIVRNMRTSLERLTEELGQKFFEEFRHRPAVGRWYDSWLFNETPQFLRWEQEWAYSPDESLVTNEARSVSGSIDGRAFSADTTPEVRVDYQDLEGFTSPQESPRAHEFHMAIPPSPRVIPASPSASEFSHRPESHQRPDSRQRPESRQHLESRQRLESRQGFESPSTSSFSKVPEHAKIPDYRPDAQVSEKHTDGPAPSATGCHCENTGPDSEHTHLCQTCDCSNQGYGCIASCGCDETCQNNFNDIALDNILGTDASGQPIKLSPCFITYLQTHKLTETITLDTLFDQLLTGLDYVADGSDEAIDAWRMTWETGYNGPDPDAHSENLQRQLLRLGLGEGDRQGAWFFSFCYKSNERIGSWQQTQQLWHCRDCGSCSERQAEWHCGNCNKCTYGRAIPCSSCGGVSDSYHTEHKA